LPRGNGISPPIRLKEIGSSRFGNDSVAFRHLLRMLECAPAHVSFKWIEKPHHLRTAPDSIPPAAQSSCAGGFSARIFAPERNMASACSSPREFTVALARSQTPVSVLHASPRGHVRAIGKIIEYRKQRRTTDREKSRPLWHDPTYKKFRLIWRFEVIEVIGKSTAKAAFPT